MRVAIFTDNDFAKVNGVTTSLRAVLSHLPEGMAARIFTASEFGEHPIRRPGMLRPERRSFSDPSLHISYDDVVKSSWLCDIIGSAAGGRWSESESFRRWILAAGGMSRVEYPAVL